MNEINNLLPKMLTGDELDKKLNVYPYYDLNIKGKTAPERLIALQDLYKVFVSNSMAREIYCKLYLSILNSLQKKQSIEAVRQFNGNRKMLRGEKYESILGNRDTFTITAPAGVGKSASVSRAINIITETPVLYLKDKKVITCLVVQSPADSSTKGLMLEILRKVDEILYTNYYVNAVKSRSTTDMLIGTISQVAMNHIALLVIDEIQNVVNSKNGKTVINALTQLINNSAVSICLVGTPESEVFFEQSMILARRTIGLSYEQMEYGGEFKNLCGNLLKYAYVENNPKVDEAMLLWIYNHSMGNTSVVVSLIYGSQEIAILEGVEEINIKTLNMAYEKRLKMLHGYIYKEPAKFSNIQKVNNKKIKNTLNDNDTNSDNIFRTVSKAKKDKEDIADCLRNLGINIIEVQLC